jgi:tRNA A37 threonylcarbamoyladenosine synthetase subunit TsaC/SUA5/YrdC
MEHSYCHRDRRLLVRGAQRVRQVKGQGPTMPLPILVPGSSTVMGLAASVPQAARDLMAACWPGLLTVLLSPQPTLAWDQPAGIRWRSACPCTRWRWSCCSAPARLIATGANAAGLDPPTTVSEAVDQLGEAFAACLDAGPLDAEGEPSTVIDCTSAVPVVLRQGAVGLDTDPPGLPAGSRR